MKLLIVEDEPRIGQYLRQGLAEAGFAVDLSDDGNEGEQLALGGDYDLLILDVMLPGRDGWQILRSVRDAEMTVPVLFLTARDAVEDRVRGLEQGADDYLVKPFAFVELLARVRTCCAGAASSCRKPPCNWPTSNSICCAAGCNARASGSTSPPRSSPCSNCCCGAAARCCPSR